MRQKKISKEKYIELFCRENRIRERKVIYVSRETHKKFRAIADLFSKQYVTVSSLVDAILSHHASIHMDMLSDLKHEQGIRFWENASRLTGNEDGNEIENSPD